MKIIDLKNNGHLLIIVILIVVVSALLAYTMINMKISLDKDVQLLVISGIIIIAVALIFAWRVRSVNMLSHHKIQALALLGLTSIALISLIVALNNKEVTSFIAVASAAAGGIAGFIAHKAIEDNKTVLSPLKNEHVKVGEKLNFTLKGISTAGYALTYSMSATPTIPEGEDAKLNPISGEFSWTPKIEPTQEEKEKEYTVTFKVTDSQGNTDSRVMKITVEKKE